MLHNYDLTVHIGKYRLLQLNYSVINDHKTAALDKFYNIVQKATIGTEFFVLLPMMQTMDF